MRTVQALKMAGESSVVASVGRLCGCLLQHAFRSASDGDILLSSLQPPSKKTVWNAQKKEKVIQTLVQVTYDFLLLRKWAWWGSWSHTSLSPLCWCRAYSYGYQTRGREGEGQRLNSALSTFTSDSESLPPLSLPTSLSGQAAGFCWRKMPSSSSWHSSLENSPQRQSRCEALYLSPRAISPSLCCR